VKDFCILKDSRSEIPIENKKSIRFLREINEKMSYTFDKCETRCKLYLKYNNLKISPIIYLVQNECYLYLLFKIFLDNAISNIR